MKGGGGGGGGGNGRMDFHPCVRVEWHECEGGKINGNAAMGAAENAGRKVAIFFFSIPKYVPTDTLHILPMLGLLLLQSPPTPSQRSPLALLNTEGSGTFGQSLLFLSLLFCWLHGI
jgi:hypothetical protein